jgi:hypothetical protein
MEKLSETKKERTFLRVVAEFMRELNDNSFINVKSSVRMPYIRKGGGDIFG